MPYKERLKSGCARKIKKPGYRVTNWSEYNRSLKKRGALSLYFPKGDFKEIFYNENTYVKGICGRISQYQHAYVQLIYTFYRLFGWGLRQMIGYFEDLWSSKGLDIPVPSFGTLSDLFAKTPLKVKHVCEEVALRLQKGEKISLIVDSTGFSFPRAREWYEKTYGHGCAQRPWRKIHVSVDPELNTHAVEVTDHTTSDQKMMDDLIPEDLKPFIEKLLADGGYYDHEKSQALMDQGIIPVIPPPKTAVVHGKQTTLWHDFIVSYIQKKGSVYAFHKKYGYGLRALIEAHFSRIKRCIGSSFKTIKIQSQQRDTALKCKHFFIKFFHIIPPEKLIVFLKRQK